MASEQAGSPFLDLELEAEVWLASEFLELKQIAELKPGEILELSRDPDEPLQLAVNGTVVATGELVVLEGRFAFRVTGTAQQQIASLDPATPPEAQP